MDTYKNIFSKILTEGINDEQGLGIPTGDGSDEFASKLGDPNNASQFDVEGNPEGSGEISQAIQGVEQAKKWIQQIDQFANFINGSDGNSLHSQIAKLDKENTIWSGLLNQQHKTLIKIASSLRQINEDLKGAINTVDNKVASINSPNGVQEKKSIKEDFVSGVNYDPDVAALLKQKVGSLEKVAPYILNIGNTVQSDAKGFIHVTDSETGQKKVFRTIDELLAGIRYRVQPQAPQAQPRI